MSEIKKVAVDNLDNPILVYLYRDFNNEEIPVSRDFLIAEIKNTGIPFALPANTNNCVYIEGSSYQNLKKHISKVFRGNKKLSQCK